MGANEPLAAGEPATSPVSDIDSPIDAFDGEIKRPGVSVFYQLGLMVVALVMIVLPLIYIALIGLAGYGVYYHATHFFTPIMEWGQIRGGRVMILKFLIYLTPIFAGSVLVFFMIKPLFAGRPPQAQPYALNADNEPLLFAFIARICELVGAPLPKRIDLDCNLNASASFRRGLLSLLGNDLVLTIGLPLVAALDMREFAGVIAHEFGHFAQGLGMRLSYVIRSINAWFARVVFERDAWDVLLAEWAHEADWRLAIMVMIAQLGVWFSRLLLHGLMLIGHGVSCFLLRQMEYDADSYEIKISGSEAFESTARKLALYGASLGDTYKEMRQSWNSSHRLPDNLPAFLVQKRSSLSLATQEKIDGELGLKTTGLFDTHPSDADRIRQARKVADPGIFHVQRPATQLFGNFPVPARIVTMLHYQDDLGLPVDSSVLIPSQEEAPAPVTDAASPPLPVASPREYFFGLVDIMKPLAISPDQLALPSDSSTARVRLNGIAPAIGTVAPHIQAAQERFTKADERMLQATSAGHLLEAGIAIQPDAFGLARATPEDVAAALQDTADEKRRVAEKLEDVTEALRARLTLGLSLLPVPETTAQLPNRDVVLAERERALGALSHLNQVLPAWQELRSDAAGLEAVLKLRGAVGPSETLDGKIASLVQRCEPRAKSLREVLDKLAAKPREQKPRLSVPFASKDAEMAAGRAKHLREEAQALVERYKECYDQLLGRLAALALLAETQTN